MALGLIIGSYFGQITQYIATFDYGSTNLLIAGGLIVMMYPPLAKVRYGKLPEIFHQKKILGLSLVQNWIIGPALMFILAIIFFHQQPTIMAGLMLIGIARCVAMVIVWNDLAEGNREYCAGLVAFNSLFTIVFYSAYAYLFITLLPKFFGVATGEIHISLITVTNSVLIYLGIPLALGALTRVTLTKIKSLSWYEKKIIPKIEPLTLIALLFTITVIFSLKSESLISLPLIVLHIAIPLIIYFVVMFFLSFYLSWKFKADYQTAASLSFTAASNNFELAITVAISVFGIHSTQALVGIIGPLIEVPVLISLVNAAFWLKKRYFNPQTTLKHINHIKF